MRPESGSADWRIGGLATIGTLFYLAYQIRQNTRTARSSAYQAASSAITAWSLEMSRDPVLMENFWVGMADPDALDQRTRGQVGLQIQALFRNYENIFYQWREGAITDQVWEGWSRQAQATLWTPGAQRWWLTWREHCNADFRRFLENSSPPEGELALPNAARQWLSG